MKPKSRPERAGNRAGLKIPKDAVYSQPLRLAGSNTRVKP